MFTVQAGPIPVPREAVPEFLRGISRKTSFTFYVIPEGASVDVYGTYWEGGSNRVYHVLDMKSGRLTGLTGPRPFGVGGTTEYTPERGEVVYVVGTFCGKPSRLEVYVRADDVRIFCGVSVDLDSDAPPNAVADRAAELGRDATLYRLLMRV
jgi:hypothetical protein